MDTRKKILERIEDVPEALRSNTDNLIVISGYFDVLTPALVARIRDISGKHPDCPILALVLEMDGALLPQRARAELAASLATIRYVLIVKTVAAALEALTPTLVVRDEENQLADRRLLIRHVQKRYQD